MLKVEKISAYYGSARALFDVSFEVKRGSITALIGSNGAGKSTTYKVILGVRSASCRYTGKVEFEGKKTSGLPTHTIIKKGISSIPEGRELFPRLTARENLLMGAIGVEAQKKEERFEFVYEIFPPLKGKEKQLAGSLSGGEQQMLAIGRALMSSPRLLIMDEPSVGLAPKIVELVYDVTKKLSESGITILISDQHINRLAHLADWVYAMELGRIVMEGPGSEVLHNEVVKRAIGL